MSAAPSTLPRIVRFLETIDSPGSSCPHCGAIGRWIHRFVVDDGRTLAAMSGCVRLFPVSRVANEEARLRNKLAGYVKSYGPSATLNRRDTEALNAIEAFYAGACDERYAVCCRRRQARQYRKVQAMTKTSAFDSFMATLGDLTLDEALSNVELDAKAYGWSRADTRVLASRVRLHFAKKIA